MNSHMRLAMQLMDRDEGCRLLALYLQMRLRGGKEEIRRGEEKPAKPSFIVVVWAGRAGRARMLQFASGKQQMTCTRQHIRLSERLSCANSNERIGPSTCVLERTSAVRCACRHS